MIRIGHGALEGTIIGLAQPLPNTGGCVYTSGWDINLISALNVG